MNTKPSIYNFIKRFLLHAVIVWLALNTWNWLYYLYRIKFDLAYTINPNGSTLSFADSFINHNVNQPLVLWVLLCAFLAEANWVFIFQRKSLVWFVFSSIVLGIAGGAISLLFTKHFAFYPIAAQFIDTAVVIMAYVAGYAVLYNFFYERYQRIKFYKQKSEAELHLLKAQINPHFFFNTLNNIYGIALSENASKTAGAVELLSDMMRYNMDGIREDFIPLKTELKFIEDYLALQQLRIPENANIAISNTIEYPGVNYKIAPMLLIPFIENAWKYGISMDKPCYINLKIAVIKHRLIMEIDNSVFESAKPEKGSGLGINNVGQRLLMIYPGLHELSIENKDGKYRLTLSIVI